MDINFFLLILRIAFVILLYLFLLQIIRAIRRDIRSARSGSIASKKMPMVTGQLVVIDGSSLGLAPGTRFKVDPVTTIGRSPTNTIVLEDSFISSENTIIRWQGDSWWVEDLNSHNGTLLNHRRVVQPSPAHSGDILQIGNVKFKLVL